MNDLDYAGLMGRAFSVPEKTAMECSLLVLGDRAHCKFRVWGKVFGINKDYLVAQTVSDDITAPTLSFFSIDGGVNWTPLPEVNALQWGVCEEIRGRFFGVPDFEYKIRRDVPPEPADKSLVPGAEGALAAGEGQNEEQEEDGLEEDEEPQDEEGEEGRDEEAEEEIDEEALRIKKNKPKYQILKVTEATRLAHFVSSHDDACKLVVRGSVVLNDKTGTVVRNRTFAGLDVAEATRLRSYCKVSSFVKDDPAGDAAKLAAAEAATKAAEEGAAAEGTATAAPAGEEVVVEETSAEKIARIASNNKKWYGPSYSSSSDFLRPITEDMPEGVWSVKYDPSLPAVAVQNLYYLGSLFYAVPETKKSGQLYIGTGERNLDICFQLPGTA